MKSLTSDLAIFGAAPAFREPLHVGRPNVGDKLLLRRRLDSILESLYLTNNGPWAREFENRLARTLGVRHCLAICNGTLALQIAVVATGMTGEAIVPAFTFIATAHALEWQGITPVFCDVDRRTHNIDPDQLETLITSKTSGVIGVHLWGRPCEVERLQEIAAKHGLTLLFDAAHAFGCSNQGRMLGNFGGAEVFSFHATKFFNSFEGGAIATNDDRLAEKVALLRNFGFAGYDKVVSLGTNGKMSEISAAMGITSLESVDTFIQVNQRNYLEYRDQLANVPGIALIDYPTNEKNNYQYVVVEVDHEEAGLSRDEIVKVLHAENILARKYFYPGCHRMEPYASRLPHVSLPVTEHLGNTLMTLPTGTAVDPQSIREIAAVIRTAIDNAAALREFLSS